MSPHSTMSPKHELPKVLQPFLNGTPGHGFSAYSGQIYVTSHKTSLRPAVTANMADLEESAKQRLTPEAFDYVAGGAGMESTMKANREALANWRIVPRMLQEVGPMRDFSCEIFGRKLPAPVVMAPVGVQALFHPDGEIATAKVFGEMGLPYTQSTASSSGFKAVADAVGEGSPKWYQLYWPSDDDLTASYLRSARANGYDVLVVTLDTWELGWRPRDLTRGYFPFIRGIGVQIGLEDAVAHQKLGFDPLAPSATTEHKEMAAMYHVLLASSGASSPTWARLHLLRELWGDGPIVLKGIQCVEDAEMAIEHGMQGIIVSNHGGRQVDGAIASLDALVQIADAVKGRITIGFDSGIRCGADIFKALALGADFVQLGRPIIYGLAHEGEKGVRHVLKSMLADMDLTTALSGRSGIRDINRSCVQRKP